VGRVWATVDMFRGATMMNTNSHYKPPRFR